MVRVFTFFFPFVLLLFSCSKIKDDTELTGKVHVQIKTFMEDMESGTNMKTKSANANINPVLYSNTVDFNEDYIMVSTLTPIEKNSSLDSDNIKMKSSNNQTASRAMAKDNTFRLLVFTTAGQFVTDRIYIAQGPGQRPTTSEELYLDAGTTYTIVAYSANTANSTDLSNMLNKLGTTARTINNSYIIGSQNQDILFFKTNYTVSGNTNDDLNILFKRKGSQVTTILDLSQTGYSMSTDVVAGYKPNNSNVEVNFDSEQLVYPTSSNATVPLTFTYSNRNNIANALATSAPIIINTNSSQNFLEISSLTINSIANSATITPFLGKEIILSPGYRYNLNVSIVPRDQFIANHKGYPAARINGRIWMRHNLGADYSKNPDVVGAESTRGNTYQWGRNIVAVSQTDLTPYYNSNNTNPTNPPNWSTQDNTDEYAWNGTVGTADYKELNPTRGNTDPCPAGYRVPTVRELKALLDATEHRQIAGSEVVMGAATMTSKRNRNVILTFPYQVYSNILQSGNNLDFNIAEYSRYLKFVFLHTSYYDNSKQYPTTKYFRWPDGWNGGYLSDYDSQYVNDHGNTLRAAAIRCIAIE